MCPALDRWLCGLLAARRLVPGAVHYMHPCSSNSTERGEAFAPQPRGWPPPCAPARSCCAHAAPCRCGAMPSALTWFTGSTCRPRWCPRRAPWMPTAASAAGGPAGCSRRLGMHRSGEHARTALVFRRIWHSQRSTCRLWLPAASAKRRPCASVPRPLAPALPAPGCPVAVSGTACAPP